jgi:hypothetical protein
LNQATGWLFEKNSPGFRFAFAHSAINVFVGLSYLAKALTLIIIVAADHRMGQRFQPIY